MSEILMTPDVDEELVVIPRSSLDKPWRTIVWNDPVNLMDYVTHVFQSYFGYPHARAHELMLQVHHDGKAAVATGPREDVERHTEAMQEFGLWATSDPGTE
ncbi:MAG: ATP-dependent Clp protease adapter ClpS [Microbacteriaceae bacterium]|nr:ATP-dependent Clp protease adapter ClpS [Microbacteriaceae bacterium]